MNRTMEDSCSWHEGSAETRCKARPVSGSFCAPHRKRADAIADTAFFPGVTTATQQAELLATSTMPATDEQGQEIAKIKATVTDTCAAALAQKVESVEESKAASDILDKLAEHAKKAETLRTSITKPMNDALKRINALFKPLADQIADATTALKRKTTAWSLRIAEENRKREQAEAKARADAEAVERERARQAQELLDAGVAPSRVVDLVEAAPAPVESFAPISKSVRTESGSGTTLVMVPQFEIENVLLVPREYLQVNETAIGKAVRAGGVRKLADGTEVPGCPPISGVRIWLKPDTRRT